MTSFEHSRVPVTAVPWTVPSRRGFLLSLDGPCRDGPCRWKPVDSTAVPVTGTAVVSAGVQRANRSRSHPVARPDKISLGDETGDRTAVAGDETGLALREWCNRGN